MNNIPPRETCQRTKKRTLSRRGVMWLGQTCNLRCHFCYFIDRVADHKHPEHAFMTLEKAKEICRTLREVYGNTAIDIQGGEPTVYKPILELIRYCRDIGLYPTLITNGLMLVRPGKLEQYRDAGIRDFLVSLHGIGDMHDEAVCVKGAYKKTIGAIERMQELGIPFRINCTMSNPVLPVLGEVAQKAIDHGANAVNYLAFNPFNDQHGQRQVVTVPRYSDIKAPLAAAIDKLEAAGLEANVRYLPLCMAEDRHRKNFYNFQQMCYDHHEWDFQSWLWTMMKPHVMKEGGLIPPFFLGPYAHEIYYSDTLHSRAKATDRPVRQGLKFAAQRTMGRAVQTLRGKETVYREDGRVRAARGCGYAQNDTCKTCTLRNICDGFHGDYAEFFGTDEAQAVDSAPLIDDPLHFIGDQDKIVEAEDEAWAL